jgi:hypothetical protein
MHWLFPDALAHVTHRRVLKYWRLESNSLGRDAACEGMFLSGYNHIVADRENPIYLNDGASIDHLKHRSLLIVNKFQGIVIKISIPTKRWSLKSALCYSNCRHPQCTAEVCIDQKHIVLH